MAGVRLRAEEDPEKDRNQNDANCPHNFFGEQVIDSFGGGFLSVAIDLNWREILAPTTPEDSVNDDDDHHHCRYYP